MLAGVTIDDENDLPSNVGRESQMKDVEPSMTEEEREEQERRFQMNRMQ